MKKLFAITIFLLIYLSSMTTFAQEKETEQAQLWYCWEATIYPDKTDQFHSLLKEEIALWKEMDYPNPFYTWTDYQYHYYFYIPMSTYDDVKKLSELSSIVQQKMGEEKVSQLWETIEYYEDYFWRYQPDISIKPTEPRLKESDDLKYYYLDIKYVKPGKEKEIVSLIKKLSDLAKQVNCTEIVDYYIGEVGYGGSTFITALPAKSASDFYINNEKHWELLGEEGKKIFKQILSLVNKRKNLQIWDRKDLSYIPVKEEIEE